MSQAPASKMNKQQRTVSDSSTDRRKPDDTTNKRQRTGAVVVDSSTDRRKLDATMVSINSINGDSEVNIMLVLKYLLHAAKHDMDQLPENLRAAIMKSVLRAADGLNYVNENGNDCSMEVEDDKTWRRITTAIEAGGEGAYASLVHFLNESEQEWDNL